MLIMGTARKINKSNPLALNKYILKEIGEVYRIYLSGQESLKIYCKNDAQKMLLLFDFDHSAAYKGSSSYQRALIITESAIKGLMSCAEAAKNKKVHQIKENLAVNASATVAPANF